MKKSFLILSIYFSTLLCQLVPYDEPSYLNKKPKLLPAIDFEALDSSLVLEELSYSEAFNNKTRYILKIQNIEVNQYYIEIKTKKENPNQKIFIFDDSTDSFWGPFHFTSKSIKIGPLDIPDINIEMIGTNFSTTHISRIYPYKVFKKSIEPIHFFNKREEPTILVTGYWPPTNEMIRHFSQNSNLNPDGWEGGNWENSGYNIVSFFPSFSDPDCNQCGQGFGDLEVDYQDTSEDFWPIVEEIKPSAIITFSRGYIDNSWEVEYNYYNRMNWYQDYEYPYVPTPNPPDNNQSAYYVRNSSLPIENIIHNITNNLSDLSLNPYIDWEGHPGQFVSEFMGYHGVWYRDTNLHGDFPCYIAGHVHVGGQIEVEDARLAADETIRTIIDYLDTFSYSLGDPNSDSIVDVLDLILIINNILGETDFSNAQFYASDLNFDGIINIQDIIQLINLILQN